MNKKIWKATLNQMSREQVFDLPKGAQVKTCAMQDGHPTIWFEFVVDGAIEHERRVFRVYGTDHDIPATTSYRGTCFDGPYVWHVYEAV